MVRKRWAVVALVMVAPLVLGLLGIGAGPVSPALAAPSGSFPEWVNFFGINSTWNGEPLSVGSEVVAYAGERRCGSFVVHTPGQYGLLPCYRARPDQVGAEPGDAIRFTINGFDAILRGPDEAVWTFNGDRRHVELEASGILLSPTPTATQTTLPTSTPTSGTPSHSTSPTPTAVLPVTQTPVWHPPTISPPTSTPWPYPTPTLGPGWHCRDIIRDGGFEAGGYWDVDPAPRPATRSTAQLRTGYYAMRLGITEESNMASRSSIRQRMDVPDDAAYALLSFHYFTVSEPDPRGNYWEALLLHPGTDHELATLWRSAAANERRWLLMNVDLTAFRGHSVDVYFNMVNDGLGGRSAMYLDDVTFQVCTPTYFTATPPPTFIVPQTPYYPPTPFPTPGGICQELIVNGDFYHGTQGWHLGRTERVPVLAPEPRRSAHQAMRLGFIEGPNANTFSSIRQAVTIPSDAISAEITFWTYLMSTSTSGQDHQEFVILSPIDNSTLALPWRVYYDNSRIWTQQRVDLSAYRGQTVVVYFNAYNDGLGGSTAMIVDDISLLACRQATPTLFPLITTPQNPEATPTVTQLSTPTVGRVSEILLSDQQETPTSTMVVSFARATPTASDKTGSSRPVDPGLVAGIAIAAAIAITLIVVFLVRGGTGRPGGTGQSGGGNGGLPGGPSAGGADPSSYVSSDLLHPQGGVNPTSTTPQTQGPPLRTEPRSGRVVSSVVRPRVPEERDTEGVAQSVESDIALADGSTGELVEPMSTHDDGPLEPPWDEAEDDGEDEEEDAEGAGRGGP